MLPVAILAGGLATRLRPLTETIPKALIEIQGRRFIDWQLRLLAHHGIERIVLCVAYKSEMIQEFLENGTTYGIEVTYSEDGSTQLGTGGAILNALPLLGDDFMVLYGDSYLPVNYENIAMAFRSVRKPALMTVYRNEGAFDTSNVVFSQGELRKYAKGDRDVSMTHIDYGLSIFNRSVFEPYTGSFPLDLSDICTKLSDSGLLAGYEVQERFYEIGSRKGIEDFSEYIGRNIDDL